MKGYCITAGSKLFFYKSEKKIMCPSLIDEFIVALAKHKGIPQDTIDRCMSDELTKRDFKRRINKCTCELINGKNISYYRIEGDNFWESIPEEDAKECLIFLN